MPERTRHISCSLLTLGVIALLTASASAQSRPGAECLCGPASSGDGIYFAEVEGGEQVRVIQIVESRLDVPDPEIIVVPGLNEARGTEILVGGRAWLVVRNNGRLSCPDGVCGSTYSVTRADATQLALSNDCFGELELVSVAGTTPACAEDGAALACSTATGTGKTGWPWLLGVALLAQRRRRASASVQAL